MSSFASKKRVICIDYHGKSEADRGQIKEALEYALKMGEDAMFVKKSIIKIRYIKIAK